MILERKDTKFIHFSHCKKERFQYTYSVKPPSHIWNHIWLWHVQLRISLPRYSSCCHRPVSTKPQPTGCSSIMLNPSPLWAVFTFLPHLSQEAPPSLLPNHWEGHICLEIQVKSLLGVWYTDVQRIAQQRWGVASSEQHWMVNIGPNRDCFTAIRLATTVKNSVFMGGGLQECASMSSVTHLLSHHHMTSSQGLSSQRRLLGIVFLEYKVVSSTHTSLSWVSHLSQEHFSGCFQIF